MALMMEAGGPDRGRPVLVADDDANLRSSVRTALERDGFRVIEASDGVEALTSLRSIPGPDLAVLDISMPRLNGLDLVRQLRAAGDPVPVIFLTSRDEELDRVLGLELGADDYLPKPFSLRELVARIRAVLRRSAVRSSARGPLVLRGSGALESLGIDRDGFRAFWAEQELDLTVTEFRILDCLAESPGAAKSREAIIARCYPEGVYLSDRVIDCHVKRLRRKLREAGAGEDLIETIYGLGYRLRP
jgi:DNA-binding response OmpR family regulator